MKTHINRNCRVVAERLLEARIKRSLSQEATARKAGVDRKTVNRIENGHFSPSLDTLLRLCRVLDIKPSNLFNGINK